jgi:hypothetical protein
MTDLGPFDDDVPFAWHAASGLKHSFLRAADELETQIGQRTSYGQEVKRDWRGRYAQEFEELADRARQEQERREIARAWKTKHDAWEREQAHRNLAEKLGDLLGGDDEPKPPDLPEIRPHPHVPDVPSIGGRG